MRAAAIEPAEVVALAAVGFVLGADAVCVRKGLPTVTGSVSTPARRLFVAVTAMHLLGMLPHRCDPYAWAARALRHGHLLSSRGPIYQPLIDRCWR